MPLPMESPVGSKDQLCVDTLRTLSLDMVEAAASGHPGLPLGAAPAAWILFGRHLRHAPSDPSWADRDRFVLSAGHGSALLYSLLHLCGYDLPLDELRRFRQWGSRTPGHPEFGHTVGVEATTGPLGQGLANAVGMAVAERHLHHRFGDLLQHRTWALVGDGDLMEGISYEAASLAGHLGLGRLNVIYDANQVSLDGPLSMAFSEDVPARFAACGWQVLEVAHGDTDLEGLDRAFAEAAGETARPTLVVVHTTIGYGSPAKAGSHQAHGAPLGAEETARTKEALGWPWTEPFTVPEEARRHADDLLARGEEARAAWENRFEEAVAADHTLARAWDEAWRRRPPAGWDEDLPRFEPGEKPATRAAGGKTLTAAAEKLPWLLGGDADLGSSTKTQVPGAGDFDGRTGAGRNLHFGVREHAMAAVVNGLAYHGGVRPYGSTFFCFSDYMRPSIRLAALGGLDSIFVFTHDSVGVGEDGPTHQPVEHLASLRAVPGLTVLRPCDGPETVEAWRWILQHREGPAALVLSRQGLPVLDRSGGDDAGHLARGAYILAEDPEARVALLATGSEVHLAVEARRLLAAEGIGARVVSMPSWEIFARQDPAWRQRVLPAGLPRVAVEAGVSLGWRRWVGEKGGIVALDRFGASAPGDEVLQRLGFTAQAVADAARRVLAEA